MTHIWGDQRVQIYGNFEGFVLTIALMVKFGCKNTYIFAFVLIYRLILGRGLFCAGTNVEGFGIPNSFVVATNFGAPCPIVGKDSYGERSAKTTCDFYSMVWKTLGHQETFFLFSRIK